MMRIELYEEPLDAALTMETLALYASIFDTMPSQKTRDRLSESENLLLLLARDEQGRAIGYKLGYSKSKILYYSWIGGVLPGHRGMGLAMAMMDRQHAWAKAKGFQKIQTKTLNKWRNMLIINIKYGFEIIETYVGEDGLLRIVMEKDL
jgi:predicted GNAT superfamily acetyltransferase